MLQLDDIPIMCISLDRRPDRWTAFKDRASAAGLRVERLSAVDAKTFDAKKHSAVSVITAHNLHYGVRRSPYEINVPGAVGASLSHFKAWEQLRSSTAPAMIVFEDDSPMPADMRARIETILVGLPAEWDIVNFHRTDFGNGVYGCKASAKDKTPWQTCDSLAGAHAYLVSRAGAEKLLARAYPIELHVDAYMAFMARLGHVRMMWHPVLDIGGDWSDTDINHSGDLIVNLPTDMEQRGIYAIDTQSLIGVVAMSAFVGGLLSLAYIAKTKGR